MRTYSDKKQVDNMGAIEPQFRSAFDSLTWGLSICYPVTNFSNEIIDFSFLYVNQMFSSTVKVKKDDLQGRNLSEFVPGFTKSDLFYSCCKALSEGKPQFIRSVKLKELLKNDPGEGHINISISACQNGIILCFQDVSDQYLTIRSNIHSGTPSENKFLQVPENDFIFSSIAPNWEQIGKLGAIAVIRTGLNYFFIREVREESKTSAEEEKISKVQTEP